MLKERSFGITKGPDQRCGTGWRVVTRPLLRKLALQLGCALQRRAYIQGELGASAGMKVKHTGFAKRERESVKA